MPKRKMVLRLGDQMRDKVTGFVGIAVSKVEYLHGCKQFGLKPLVLKDGLPQNVQYFDEPRLELVKKNAAEKGPDVEDDPGGENRDGCPGVSG